MAPDDRSAGAAIPAAPPPPEAGLFRAWHRLVEALAALGTLMICLLGLIICADIVARNAMGASLPLISEMGALLVVMIVALQLAAAVRADRLARTEVFFVAFAERFPRPGAALGLVFNIIGAAILGIVAKASVRIFLDDWEAGEFIGIVGMATLPTWPFRGLILIGFAVAAIEFLVRAFADLRIIARGPK